MLTLARGLLEERRLARRRPRLLAIDDLAQRVPAAVLGARRHCVLCGLGRRRIRQMCVGRVRLWRVTGLRVVSLVWLGLKR